MFQLPPRTLANCIPLLIIKARKNKKDNASECFTETALYTSQKSIGYTRKKYFSGDTDGIVLYRA